MATAATVRRERAAAQLLHRPNRSRPADLLTHLLAVQAQDIRYAPLALRARARGLTAADITAARERREIVRAWGPRGTIHLLTRDDVGWVGSLLLPSSRTGAMRRLTQEGVAGSMARLVTVTGRALAGQGPLTKVELGERLARLGCPATGQGIVHLAFLAATHGLVVLGPDRGGKPTYVHSADWLGAVAKDVPDREKAREELAVRYLRAHGPAAPEDLAAWSGLALGEARSAWSGIADRLAQIDLDGRPLWRLRTRRPAAASGLALLPSFDEYLLGWRDRTLVLDPTHAKAIAPGGGIINPAIVADGLVVGTWRPNPFGTTLFSPDVDPAALAREAADLTRFETVSHTPATRRESRG